MTLTPAYGRDYKSGKEVKADFAADKDFVIADMMHPNSGAYVNKSQLVETGVRSVNIRFKQNRNVVVVKV